MGSRGVSKSHFKQLTTLGGEVEVFFPSILPLINPRLNFRNHRKIVVIDGRIGYIGGFNVGDEYLGLQKDSAIGATHIYGLKEVPYIHCKHALFSTGIKQVLNSKLTIPSDISQQFPKKANLLYKLFRVDPILNGRLLKMAI